MTSEGKSKLMMPLKGDRETLYHVSDCNEEFRTRKTDSVNKITLIVDVEPELRTETNKTVTLSQLMAVLLTMK